MLAGFGNHDREPGQLTSLPRFRGLGITHGISNFSWVRSPTRWLKSAPGCPSGQSSRASCSRFDELMPRLREKLREIESTLRADVLPSVSSPGRVGGGFTACGIGHASHDSNDRGGS